MAPAPGFPQMRAGLLDYPAAYPELRGDLRSAAPIPRSGAGIKQPFRPDAWPMRPQPRISFLAMAPQPDYDRGVIPAECLP